MTRADFSGLWDQLLSEGMNTITIDEIESRTGVTRNAVYLGVKYAIDRKRLFSPARGLYVVVPPEYRRVGVVPAVQFIDPMMSHLGIDYYLGLATAASWWGSSHHASQEFQVIVNSRLPNRTIGNVRFRFISRAKLDAKSIRRVAGPRTMLNVSTPTSPQSTSPPTPNTSADIPTSPPSLPSSPISTDPGSLPYRSAASVPMLDASAGSSRSSNPT